MSDVISILNELKENTRLVRQSKLAEHLLIFLGEWLPGFSVKQERADADRFLSEYMKHLKGSSKAKKVVRDKLLDALFTTSQVQSIPQDDTEIDVKIPLPFERNPINTEVDVKIPLPFEKKKTGDIQFDNEMPLIAAGMVIGFFILIFLLIL